MGLICLGTIWQWFLHETHPFGWVSWFIREGLGCGNIVVSKRVSLRDTVFSTSSVVTILIEATSCGGVGVSFSTV